MKYVVTGATSFLGRELVSRLLQDGHEVVAVCRPQSSALADIPLGVEVVLADMSDYGGLYRDVPEADVWVNLAWEGTGHDGRNQEEVQQANVIHTIAAMFGADKMGCRLFVEAGSQAEYGTVLTPISEQTPCNPFSAYGKAKFRLGWEPRTDIDTCCQLTADWYRRYRTEDVYQLCVEQIKTFLGY